MTAISFAQVSSVVRRRSSSCFDASSAIQFVEWLLVVAVRRGFLLRAFTVLRKFGKGADGVIEPITTECVRLFTTSDGVADFLGRLVG